MKTFPFIKLEPMKKQISTILSFLLIVAFVSCRPEIKPDQTEKYVPVDQDLFDEVMAMDKVFFDAYNTCDLQKQASIYANEIEFFHDKGGLINSKKEIMDGTEKNICGKVTRQLVEGSVEIYPIKNYGAVEIGLHQFHNKEEPDAVNPPSKFIIMWHKDKGNWRITKVVSLH